MSIRGDILGAVTTTVNGLALTNGSATFAVVGTRTNRAEPGIDSPPEIVVCYAEQQEKSDPFAFGPGSVPILHKTYLVEITINNPNPGGDLTADSIPLFGSWRESIINAFKPGKSSVSQANVWDVDVIPDDFEPRAELMDNWDKMTVQIAVHTHE